MISRITKDFIVAALVRAIKTAAQVMLSMITVGAAITGFDWKNIIAIAATSFVYSMLTSIVLGVPEGEYQGSLSFTKDEARDGIITPALKIDIPGNDLLNSKSVNIKVEKEI